ERIASIDNLIAADREAQKGKRKRRIERNGKVVHVINRYIRRHNQRQMQELRELQLMILTLELPPCAFTAQEIKTDAGKIRVIVKQNFYPWRILHHAILRVIETKVYRSLIPGTFACIKGRGLHYGVKLLKRMLRRHPEWKWFWKTDFKKFYQSIPHELIENEFTALFKDRHFIILMRIVLFQYDSGDEIVQILADESERTKRNAHWSSHEPDDRQSHRQKNRPRSCA
ncbi:MAG: hypothetical protein NC131_21885, partial [Roseburia sp.]|nr:hypothetical protein [Roseburia sp.]